MNISFRHVQARDMKPLRLGDADWKKIQERKRLGGGIYKNLPSSVVTIDSQVVLAFDWNDQVMFQDDRFPIADLVRADRRVWKAMRKVDFNILARLKRERRGEPTTIDEALRRWAT